MNGDPLKWRITLLVLILPGIVGAAGPGMLSPLWLVPAVMFCFWRAWARRRGSAAFKPHIPTYPLLPSKPLELDVIDVDYEVIE